MQSAWWEPQARAEDAEPIARELALAALWQGLENVSVSGWGDAANSVAGALHISRGDVQRHVHVREGSI
ncbi:hypothetical protein [Microbacterium sp. CH12i]|uniref:hypothetical protein n=1 Tax=Microbacterium sp. CH12i TaxID=1479651 RepID=UPI000B30C113